MRCSKRYAYETEPYRGGCFWFEWSVCWPSFFLWSTFLSFDDYLDLLFSFLFILLDLTNSSTLINFRALVSWSKNFSNLWLKFLCGDASYDSCQSYFITIWFYLHRFIMKFNKVIFERLTFLWLNQKKMWCGLAYNLGFCELRDKMCPS